MRLIPIVVLSSVTAFLITPRAESAEPILRQTFAKDAEGWVVMGQASGSVQGAAGQLSFRYTAAPQGMSVAILPAGNIPLSEMKSLRFELRTDSPAAVGVVLSEKKPGGGNYSAAVWSNGTDWQAVALSPGDFTEGERPGEPADTNGKLDLDQVEGLGLLDVSQIFSRLSSADSPISAKARTGDHTISIRNFEISREGITLPSGLMVDDFSRPQAGWMALEDATISQSGGVMKIDYQQREEKVVAFLHTLPSSRDFRGATHIAFDIESSRPGQFALSLAEGRHHKPAEGPRYNVDFFVPAGQKLEHREIVLSAFNPDENGTPDSNGKLDLDDLRSVSLLDISREQGRNVLKISNLRFVKH